MTERLFWSSTVRPILGAFGKLERIENRVGDSTPDVCYCLKRQPDWNAVSGWIELKHGAQWPVRPATKFKFSYFTLGQMLWLEEWHNAGGRCCMLAQIERDYMLVPPWRLRAIFDGVTKSDFMALSEVNAHNVFPTSEVVRWLTR
jgi:hypothetical protein